MTTSGTTSFSPSLGSLVGYSYGRCGVRRTALIQEHFEDARMASNMVLADWGNRGVNLWRVALFTTSLAQGTATYDVDPSVIVILDAYISSTASTTSVTQDRIILPVSRSEYASYSNKGAQGSITTYWHDRLLSPTVTVYQTPDGTQPYLRYYALQQIEDANFTSGQTVDIPYVWLKAFADGLAVELAVIYAPDRVAMLQGFAATSYEAAASTGTEISAFYLSPMISGYYR